MNMRISALVFAVALPLCTNAQENVAARDKELQAPPEEMLIIGERVRHLRTQMMEAEIHTYDLFNRFNDEKRYVINCSVRAATGTHFKKVMCDTGFERDAMQQHARDWVDGTFSVPAEALIAAQHPGFRRKMKQVAEQHPEFLQAVIQYTKLQKEYEEVGRTWKQQD